MKVRRFVQKLLPWAPKADRRQAITAARRDRIAAERRAEQAREAENKLRAAVCDNHIAQAIADHLRGNR